MEFSQRRRVVSGLQSGPLAGQSLGPIRSLAANRRRPRTANLLQTVQRLDVEIDPAARAALAGWVREEYASEYGPVPIGFLAVCHLGPPYVDHRLDLFQSIVEHYGPADPVPDPYAQARMLVRTGRYAFVEIHSDGAIHPVLHDGTVVV